MLVWEGKCHLCIWMVEMNGMGAYLKKLSILSFQVVEKTDKCLK